MRPASTLSARHRGDRVGDVPCLHPLLHQIVGDGHMHAGPRAVREQEGDGALVARAECIHDEADLITIFQIRIGDVQLDITAWWWQLLPRLACHSDDVADPSNVQHHEIRTGSSHNPAEVSDHLIAALANLRLRAWQRAIAMASRA